MKVIIETLDLNRMWGKDKDMPSVTPNTFPEDTFTVRLNRGEMLPLKYRITIPMLLKLESLNGSCDVVIVSKQERGGKKENSDEYYYNEVVTAVYTLDEYVKVAKKATGFQSRFAKPMPPKDKPTQVATTAGPQQHELDEEEVFDNLPT